MTKPTHPLSPEQERAVNQRLLDFSGMATAGWKLSDDGPYLELWHGNVEDDGIFGPRDVLPSFTRSLDSLRLVEEKLSIQQWDEYIKKLFDGMVGMNLVANSAAIFCEGMRFAMDTPISRRAAVLAEVVG